MNITRLGLSILAGILSAAIVVGGLVVFFKLMTWHPIWTIGVIFAIIVTCTVYQDKSFWEQ